MSLTLSQAFERTKDLSGEIKAAQEMVRVTEQEVNAAEHTASLARQAHDKAQAALAGKLEERTALADYLRELTLQVGEDRQADAHPEAFPNFGSQLYANGADAGVTEAFERATNP